MALFAKLVDTSPTIKEFKKLQECLSSVADSFESLENVIPDSFSKNTKSAGTSIEHFSSSINELGNSFINISSYGERAVRVLNNISKVDGDLSLPSALTSLSDRLREIKDTSPVDDLAVSLKRLGDAMSSISKHGIDAANTMQLLAQGGSFSFAGDAPDLKVNKLSDTYKELVDSFDTSFKGVDLKESAITSVSNTMRVFKNALKLFDDDSMELAKKLADTDALNQIKNGVVNFAEVFKEVRVLFYKTVMTDTESNDSTTIKTTTTEKNIDGILNTMKALKPAITSINDIISSESFNNLTANATTIQKNFQAVGDIFASINTAFESKTTKIKSPETTVTADFEGIGNRLKAAMGLLNPLSDASDLQVGGKKTTTTNTTTTQVDLAIQGLLSLIKKVNQGVAEVNDIVKPDSPLHKFETEIGPKIKSQFNALGTSLQSIKAVFRESIEKTTNTTTSGSKQSNTKTTAITAPIHNILDILKGIPAALKELRKVVDSDEFKNARDVMSSVKTLFKDIGDSLASVGATFTDKVKRTTTNESGIKTTTTEVTRSIDGITSLLGSIKKRFKKFASLKDDPALTNFNTVMTEVKEKLSSFVTSMNELSLEANFESTTKKGTFKIPVIDRVLSIISNLNSTIKKVANEAHPLKDKFLSVISKDVVEPIKEAVDILNGVDILLMEDPGGSGKKIAVIDKVVAYIRAITGVMNNVNKVPDNVANRLTILASAISMSMSTLSNAATGPVFERFERLTNVLLNFSIATKSIVTNVDKAERSMAKLSKTTHTATKSVNWFAGGWRSVVNAFTGGTLIYTIVRSIRDAINEFVELDKKLRQINTLVGMSERSLSNLGSTIVSTAGKFGLNLGQAADSMFAIQSATLRGADAVRVFNASAMLSVAGNADLKNSTELITRSLMAYGKHSTEAQHIADVLFKTQDRGITVIEELAHNLTKAIPSAVAARVSFEEINAAMATLTTRGLQTTVASTALNSMILKLTSGSERLNAVFQRLGYESSATALKQKGLEYVMRQISAATGGAAYELQKLGFNYRDIKAAAILANDTNGFFAETLKYINNEAEEGGKALQAYKEVCKSLGQQVAQIVASLKGAVVGISEFVAKWSGLKIILGLLNSFVQIKSDFTSFSGALKVVLGTTTQVVLGITAITTSVTLLSKATISLLPALKKMSSYLAVFSAVKGFGDISSVGALKGVSGGPLGSVMRSYALYRKTLNKYRDSYKELQKAGKLISTFGSEFSTAADNYDLALKRMDIANERTIRVHKIFQKSLKSSLALLGKFALVASAITAVALVVDKAWTIVSEGIANGKAILSERVFSAFAKDLSEVKTIHEAEYRIKALSDELDRLSRLAQTKEVRTLMQRYQKDIEALNRVKSDLGAGTLGTGDAFNKLYADREKRYKESLTSFQKYLEMSKEVAVWKKQASALNTNSSAWAKLANKIENTTAAMQKLNKENLQKFNFISEAHFAANSDSVNPTRDNAIAQAGLLNMHLSGLGLSKATVAEIQKLIKVSVGESNLIGASLSGAYTVMQKKSQQMAQVFATAISDSGINKGVSSLQDVLFGQFGLGDRFKVTPDNLAAVVNVVDQFQQQMTAFQSNKSVDTKASVINSIQAQKAFQNAVLSLKTITAGSKANQGVLKASVEATQSRIRQLEELDKKVQALTVGEGQTDFSVFSKYHQGMPFLSKTYSLSSDQIKQYKEQAKFMTGLETLQESLLKTLEANTNRLVEENKAIDKFDKILKDNSKTLYQKFNEQIKKFYLATSAIEKLHHFEKIKELYEEMKNKSPTGNYKAVPVSEQVSITSAEAYSMLYKQTQENAYNRSMRTHVSSADAKMTAVEKAAKEYIKQTRQKSTNDVAVQFVPNV